MKVAWNSNSFYLISGEEWANPPKSIIRVQRLMVSLSFCCATCCLIVGWLWAAALAETCLPVSWCLERTAVPLLMLSSWLQHLQRTACRLPWTLSAHGKSFFIASLKRHFPIAWSEKDNFEASVKKIEKGTTERSGYQKGYKGDWSPKGDRFGHPVLKKS